MVKSCCVVGCHEVFKAGGNIKFHRFPKDEGRRAKWTAAVRRENWTPNDNTWICSQHFVNGEKSNNPLAPNYIPTIFPQLSSPEKRKQENDVARFEKRQKTKCKKFSAYEEQVASSNQAKYLPAIDVTVQPECSPIREDTDFTSSDETTYNEEFDIVSSSSLNFESFSYLPPEICCTFCPETKQKLTGALEKCKKLERKSNALLLKTVTRDSLVNDDNKVKYYTGLPSFEALNTLVKFVSVGVPSSFVGGLCDCFEQIVITLMRLRLNLGIRDLGYRFGVHESTILRYFSKWLDILEVKLAPFIKWPDRDELQKTMPMEFREKFRKCTIIIDCFEIFIERPTSLLVRAQTWSNYKKHNTIKYLIGITPQGSVAFISKGWGGRASDVHITEHCGILDNLLPGDVVLADQGFTIEQSVGMFCAEVKHPTFTRGKKQLSKLEVDTTQQLAKVRIHVERVIGTVHQKYTLFQGTLPISMVMCNSEDYSTIDKILLVCCALHNHCDSVVPFD